MDLVSYIRQYNLWRRGDDTIETPDPKKLGEALAALCDYAERLEAALETLINLNNAADGGSSPVEWEPLPENEPTSSHREQRLVSRYLRGSHDCRKTALERMISDMRRNHPEWPSTFGPCSEGCGGSGRGSGPCADCIERAIGLLVGQPMAAVGLHIAIHTTRKEARKLRDLIYSPNAEPIRSGGGVTPSADLPPESP